MSESAHHEDLARDEAVPVSGHRSFGLVMGVAAAVVALAPLRHGNDVRLPWAAVSVAFLIAAAVRPTVLAPLNRVWHALGMLLSRVTTPLILAILFFIGFVTVGGLRRLFRPDPLKERFDGNAKTYWIARVPPGPDPQSLRQQF